ncbi:MAG: PEP-CTERM sorting domain-containing protein [Burkholderiales bacterium]
MTTRRLTALAAAVAGALASAAVQAQTYGYLANFDAINNTGHTAYGFEIQLEDIGLDHTKITSVFGYDRDFGTGNPGSVVRYGSPTITDLKDASNNAIGVLIRYGGSLTGPFTLDRSDPLAAPFNTGGDSCWPFGAGWSTGTACDHFGVSTIGQPATTKYNWLVQATPGVLTPVSAGIPAVNFAYTPPVGGGAGELEAHIEAEAPEYEQPENEGLWGEAYWVKTYTTKVNHDIHLGNLFRDDPLQQAAEIETEWELLQRAPVGEEAGNANQRKGKLLALAPEDAAVMRRYEFYEYLGPFKPDGEADCSKGCGKDPVGDGMVGKYLGAQMAGFNVNDPQLPIQLQPVPEPQTYAMVGAGLALLGLVSRRRRR